MKFTAAFVVASVAGYAAAQSACLAQAESISSCGQSCLINAGSSFGCQSTDFQCQCSHSAEIQQNPALTSCVISACPNLNDALAVSASAVALCSCIAKNGGVAAVAAGTSTAAVPATTVALGSVPAAAASAASTTAAAAPAAATTAARTTATSSKVALFTGAGAIYTAGSVGGIFAGVMGLIAAL